MRLISGSAAICLMLAPLCVAQTWEIGTSAGYGLYHNTSIGNDGQSATAGVHSGLALGAVFGENPYDYIGGELRYLYRWGSPELQYQGSKTYLSGYSNIIVYDLLVHMTPRDSKVRPYAAGGAGIKIYTGTGTQYLLQPADRLAVFVPSTQVEPAISVGGGLKYRLAPHVLLRADFRTYMTPLPNELFRVTGTSTIRGWVFDFVPMLGISRTF